MPGSTPIYKLLNQLQSSRRPVTVRHAPPPHGYLQQTASFGKSACGVALMIPGSGFESPALLMAAYCSAPAKVWREMAHHTLDEVRVVVDAELVRNGEKQCVRRGNCLVVAEFLHQLIRLAGVRLAESG